MDAAELTAILTAERVEGFFDTALKERAENLFNETSFTLVSLHGHLLLEKALNVKLRERGVPEAVLGEDGLTFHQKYEAYFSLAGLDKFQRKMFRAMNRLRNNVAHDFWDDDAGCLRSALEFAFQSKAERAGIDSLVKDPIHSVRYLFFGMLNDLGALDTAVRDA